MKPYWLILLVTLLVPTTHAQQEEGSVDRRQTRQIKRLFQKIGDQFLDDDFQAVESSFDLPKLIESTEQRGILDLGSDDRQRDTYTRNFKTGFNSKLHSWGELISWYQFEVTEIRRNSDDSVSVMTRHWDDSDEVYFRMQWWLHDTDTGWKIFDLADVDSSLRVSTMMAIGFNAAKQQKPWLEPMRSIVNKINELGDLNSVILDESLIEDTQAMLHEDAPEDVRFFGLLAVCLHQLYAKEDPAGALVTSGEMAKINSSAPVILLLQADAHQLASQPEQALKAYRQYAERFGWDAETCETVSDIHYNLKNKNKSAEFAEMGLADQPTSWGCLASLAVALPANEKSKLSAHFAKIGNDLDAMELVTNWAINNDDLAAARQILSLMRQHHPDSPLINLYQEQFDQ